MFILKSFLPIYLFVEQTQKINILIEWVCVNCSIDILLYFNIHLFIFSVGWIIFVFPFLQLCFEMDYIRRLNNKVMTNKVFPIPKEKLKDNVLHKFCGETSLPGWPYLNREMSQVWKMIWILFLLAACGTSVYVLV